MLDRLKRLFRRKPPPDDERGEYVFAYPLSDGTTRHFDPLDVRAKLKAALPDWQERVRDVWSGAKPLPPGTPDALANQRAERVEQASAALTDAASAAFGLPPVDAVTGTGYTRVERMLVLAAYLIFSGEAVEIARPLAGGGGPSGSQGTAPSPPANASA